MCEIHFKNSHFLIYVCKCNPQIWEPKYQVIQSDNKQFKNILEYLKYSVILLILMQLVQLYFEEQKRAC